MRVVGGSFYFIDAVVERIKRFKAPGKFVWESQTFENLGYYAVNSKGQVYLVWGVRLDQLSALDANGKLLWTKALSDVLSPSKMRSWRLLGWDTQAGWIYWTPRGLVIEVVGADPDRTGVQVLVLVNQNGAMEKVLPGQVVDWDGNTYGSAGHWEHLDKMDFPLTCRNPRGKVLRKIDLRQYADPRAPSAAKRRPAFGRLTPDPSGGLSGWSAEDLPSPIRVNSRYVARLEEVVQRIDRKGNYKELWGFPKGPFAGRAPQTVIGTDGCVYHLEFGDKGISVIKYYR
ncbi:MAG TPA: hypothetical protein VGM37_11350 [Armatimonadota bacterium]|jgi:hypothetical protein